MALNKFDPNRKKIFVNRDGPLAIFNEAATAIPHKGQSLRVFYGMGGQGKTALCNHIRDHHIPNHKHLKHAHLDLAIGHVSDGVKLLIKLRNGFARSGVAMGGFDFALAIVWEYTRKEETYPDLVKPMIARSKDAVGDVVADTGNVVRELVEKEVETWPGFGTIMRLVSRHGIKKGHETWLFKSRNYMLALMDDRNELKPGDQLVEILPWMLAQDLNHHRSKQISKNQKHRFVILIDEYETLLEDLVMSRAAKDGNFDAMLQMLITETDGLLVLFFLRGELPWKDDPDWREELAGNQQDIFGLKDKDAHDWLVQEGVTDTALQDAMIESGRATSKAKSLVCPLFLELQVEYWRSMAARKQDIHPDDFCIDGTDIDTRRRQLLQRLLRNANYGEALEHTLERLSVAERFDQDAFNHIIEACKTKLPHDAWAHVCGLGFINSGEDNYHSFHRAVGEALHAGLDSSRRTQSVEILLDHYTERATVKDNFHVTDASVAALLEAAYLRRKLGADGYVDWLFPLLEPVLLAARYGDCNALWQTAFTYTRQELGEEHNDTDACNNNLAFILKAQGRYDEAEPLYKKGLEITLKVLGEEHFSTATSYNNLASNLNAQGRYDEAEPLYEKGLEIKLKVLGEDHPDTATSYNNVGFNLNAQGRYDEAEPLYKKGLEIRLKVLGEEHPNTASSYNNVASNLNAQGRYDEAEPLYKKGLGILLKVLGEDHPSTAASYNNVASNLDDQGRYDEAEPLYKKGLEIRLKLLGEDHPSTAASYNNVGYNLFVQGRVDEAEPYFRKAVAIWEKTLGPDHPNTQTGRANLADLLAAIAEKNE